jgi:hypothetical protein
MLSPSHPILQQVLCQPFRFKVGSSIASDAAAFPYRSPQVSGDTR